MATPVRYPKGVTNVTPQDACANLPIPSRTRVHYFFEDFDFFDATEVAKWSTTTDEASATVDLIDGDGGIVRISPCTVSEKDQVIYTPKEIFTLESGKRFWYGIRFKMTVEYTEMGIQAGLHPTVATQTAVSTTNAEWIGFYSTSDDATIDFAITSGGARVAQKLDLGVGDMDGAFHTYEFEFDGVDQFKYFVDGVHIGTVATTSFPTTEMGLVIASMAWSSSVDKGVMDIDWVYAAKERETVND